MDTEFQISLFLLRVFSFSLYIIIFMYSLGFAKIGSCLLPNMILLTSLDTRHYPVDAVLSRLSSEAIRPPRPPARHFSTIALELVKSTLTLRNSNRRSKLQHAQESQLTKPRGTNATQGGLGSSS